MPGFFYTFMPEYQPLIVMRRKNVINLCIWLILVFSALPDCRAQKKGIDRQLNLLANPSPYYDNRVDNMFYWRQQAKNGLIKVADDKGYKSPIFKGTQVVMLQGSIQDSPDVLIEEGLTTQSENSVFVNPNDNDSILNSNNSSDYPAQMMFGANYQLSEDAGQSWEGQLYGAGEDNAGDPAAAISLNGTMYIGKINAFYGQSVARSVNGGQTWDDVVLASVTGYPNLLDKNHLWVDNSTSSPFLGNVYAAWTRFGGNDNGLIQVARSINNGISWSTPVNISTGVNALAHSQGVNIQTGPNGELYLVWAIYDTWPGDENALGFARSFDGGQTFEPAYRILNNINGLRNSLTSKNMRVSGFPGMAVDQSNGPNRGTIYVVWNNLGIPGVNTGPDIDVYLIKSTNNGASWSNPIKVNQDTPGLGKEHFMPWITCDPITGTLSVIFFDDRNTGTDDCEVWVANSYDGGQSWEDFRVSDFAFTPSPIPGLGGGYMGDYLGITAYDRKVYPVWSDNRSGNTLAYASPFETGPPPNQPYVIYQNLEITPADPSNEPELIFGDSVHFTITMKNIGDEAAQNVNVTLSSTSPYIQITDSTENYGNFNISQSIAKEEAYTLKVSDTIPDGINVRFDLKATDGDSTWYSHFRCVSKAPQLAILTFAINDEDGNANSILDPGEQAIIKLWVQNTGDFPLESVLCSLTTSTPDLQLLQSSSIIPQLVSNQIDTAFFLVKLSSSAPYGINLLFHFKAQSGLHVAQKDFFTRVGLIVEDWETGSFQKYPWIRSGNKLFSIASNLPYEGHFCAASGDIDDEEESVLSISYQIASDDSVSFWYKTSTESNYDQLQFYVDNIRYGKWSGIRDWKRISFKVPAGNHTLRWQYTKDPYFSAGEDKVWIDYISLPVFNLPQVEAGADRGICANEDSVHIEAVGSNYSSITWTTAGDGVFNQPQALITDYFPGLQDITNGKVSLKVKAITNMAITEDSLTVYIQSQPNPPTNLRATPATYCLGSVSAIQLAADSVSGDSIIWYLGSCNVNAIGNAYLTKVIAPTSSQVYFAQISNACGDSPCDSIGVTVFQLPSINLGNDTSICTLQTLILDPGSDFISYLWSTGSTSRFLEIDSIAVPVGSSAIFRVSVVDSNGCETADSIKVTMTHCPGWGINESLIANRLELFPNPASTYLGIKFNGPVKADSELEILDANGKAVYTQALLATTVQLYVDLMAFAKGAYFVRIKGTTTIQKFLIN